MVSSDGAIKLTNFTIEKFNYYFLFNFSLSIWKKKKSILVEVVYIIREQSKTGTVKNGIAQKREREGLLEGTGNENG